MIGNIPHQSTCLEILFSANNYSHRDNRKIKEWKDKNKMWQQCFMIILLRRIRKINFLTVVRIRTPASGHVLARCAIAVVWFELVVTRQGWNVLVERLVHSALLALSGGTRERHFPCGIGIFGLLSNHANFFVHDGGNGVTIETWSSHLFCSNGITSHLLLYPFVLSLVLCVKSSSDL